MRGYESPEIVENIDVMEGIYAASGYTPEDKDDEEEGGNSISTLITVTAAEWYSHNGGSHSDGHVKFSYHGPEKTTRGVKIKIGTNFDFLSGSLDGLGSCVITEDGTRNFTLTRTNTDLFNSTENFDLNFSLKGDVTEYIKNGQKGAVGDSAHPTATQYCFKIISVETF